MENTMNYEAPQVELLEVAVEQGFAGSDMEGVDPEGGEHL